LIDGEGCISLAASRQRSRTYYNVRIDVGMTDKAMAVLEWLRLNYGGVINHFRKATEKWDSASTWRTFGARAACLLRRWMPYLVLKKEQARLAIWFEENKGISQKEKTRLHSEMKEMNRKGPRQRTSPKINPSEMFLAPFAVHADGEWWIPQMDLFTGTPSGLYCGTFPRSGGAANGIAFQRPPSAPRTSAIVSSCWLPTPTASQYGSSQNGINGVGGANERPSAGTLSLFTMAAKGLLPTPTATDAKSSGNTTTQWSSARHTGTTLTDAVVRMLPTPTARDMKGAALKRSPSSGKALTDALGATGGKLPRLSPRFVEWMMGLPLGWTEIRTSSWLNASGPTASTPSATPSSRRRRRGPGKSSMGGSSATGLGEVAP